MVDPVGFAINKKLVWGVSYRFDIPQWIYNGVSATDRC
ncbi:hypothetical protein SAMN05216464_11158 [Mucilaginibacter pineti]|uniref:Uncharacterized protein n=1 Tax=Mucilaginibacter pineti TaxID=1391627 RepID=A0A1G7H4M6_9SPHI|nr:hypothetical protein SAMN05216464_11158 [Mucilaginibacter pineti]